MKSTQTRRNHLRFLAFALMLGTGSAQAQFIVEVGGAATIGDQVLTTSKVPTTIGANWQVVGNNGGVYSGLVSPNVVVANTGAVTLTFTHRYNFEATYDGGALFVSVNGGAFTYVPMASFTSGGYDTTGLADPLSGTAWLSTNVFGGKSVGYDTPTLITSVADLGTLNATDTVAVEFRGGWDGASLNGPVAWEISSVNISDTGGALLNKNFIADGASAFTVANIGAVTAPWAYPKATNRFEINANTLAADRYQPNIVGSAIDLDGANIEVVRVPGTTLVAGSTFTLFDLSGGTTLTGSFGNVALPGGRWDTSNLAVNGTITLLEVAPPGIYEPFDYPGTVLDGASGTTEYGLNGAWTSIPDTKLGAGRSFGPLVTRGAGIADLGAGSNRFGGARGVTVEALAQYNLLNDGAELWFSCIVGTDSAGGPSNSRLAVALGAGSFGTGTGDFWINGGTGVGVYVSAGKPAAATFPANTGSQTAGTSTATTYAAATSGLIVGKITWALNPLDPDTIEIYQPNAALVQGSAVSTTTAVLDQTTYDTLTFRRGDRILLDEIRFGSSYAAVTETGGHWDLNGTTAASGSATPAGTWDASSNWNPTPDGTGVTAALAADGVAVFAAGTDATGAYSVTVDSTQDLGGVVVEEGAVTVTGGTALRAKKNTNVSVATGLTATIATPFTEDMAGRQIAKSGPGTLVLSGNNSGLTGGMNLSGGAAQFDSPSAIPGTARNIAVNPAGAAVFGSGVSSGDIATALANRITASSAGAIAANNQTATNFDFSTPGLTAASLGAVGSVNYNGTLTPNGTTYRLGGGGGTLTMANTNAITGANSLVVNPNNVWASGTVVLAADNDYTGATTVNGTTLRIMGATGTSGITLNQPAGLIEIGANGALGGGLTINGGFGTANSISAVANVVSSSPIQANSSFNIVGSNSLTLGTMSLNTNTTITNTNTTATTTYTAITAIGGARTLAFSGNANSVVTGAIGGGTGVSTVTKNGTGTLTLSGTNSFTGIATAAGGVLLLNHADALPGGIGATGGTTGLTINAGMIGLGVGDFSRPLAAAGVAGSVTMTGNGGWAAYGADRLVNLGGASASVDWATASTGLNARTLILSHSTATHKVTLQNPIVLGTAARTVQVDDGTASFDAELSGALTGSAGGNLSKTGAGTLVLSGNNTIVGTTTVSAGTLILSGTNTLTGLISCAAANSTLTLTGNNSAGAAGVTLNNATAVLNVNSNNAFGTGTVTLTAGTFNNTSGSSKTLTTNNTVALTGNTIWGGGNDLTFGTGPVNLNASRILTLNGTGILTFGGVLTNTQAGNPTLTVTGASKTMLVNGTALSNSGTLRTVTVNGDGNLTISAAVVGSSTSSALASTLTKSGAGTLTLQGNNTYTGNTTVNTDGELHLANGSQASAITVNSGAFVGFTIGSSITSSKALNLQTGHKVRIHGTPVAPNSYTLITAASIGGTAAAPVLDGTITDYELVKDGATLKLNYIPGPVDHFVISAISSPQTVGTPITGITITAQDVYNATALSFTGTVTFGGTGGFTGTSASFTSGVLSGVSVTPTNAGSNLTFTVDDGASHTGSTTITTINPAGTAYQIWATGSEPFNGDANGDGVKDGLAFLLGAATPSENAIGKLPVVTQTAGSLIVTFDCLNTAARGTAVLNVAHSSDLGISDTWTSALVPGAAGSSDVGNVHFEVTGTNPIHVVATISSVEAAAGKLFGRLKAQE